MLVYCIAPNHVASAHTAMHPHMLTIYLSNIRAVCASFPIDDPAEKHTES